MSAINYIPNLFRLLLVLVFSLGISISNFAQDTTQAKHNTFSLSGQFRPRAEFRYGAFRPLNRGEKPAALISERLRINFDYSYKNILSLRFSPQNVSVWGQANMVQGAENNGSKFAIFEAWALLNASPSWNFKIGRQIISLDDERFFGELDWAQGGRVHDAVSINFSKNNFEVKSFFAFNQNYKEVYGNNLSNAAGNFFAPTDALPYKWMQTVWAAFPVSKKDKITVLATNLGFQNYTKTDKDTRTYFSQTFGLNYTHKGEKFVGNLSGYYQRGKNLKGLDGQGYMAAVYAGYIITPSWELGIGSDLVSGNNFGSASKQNMIFTPYFATGHKFYGFMDYYYAGNAHGNVGLSDSYLKLNYKWKKGLTVNLAIHQFLTPNSIADNIKNHNHNLGQELDLTASYNIYKFINISGGYSFYLSTPTLNLLKNTLTANIYQQWAWLSLNINPTLFKTKF